ncbi:MAG: response regulator [Candidatus Solibacter sp.]|nr:response regulator [Candidatus Solibacter sp.]
MPKNKKIVAAVEDLFFVVKINDLAKRAGFTPEFIKTQDAILERVSAEPPALLIVDLNNAAIDAVGLISKVKAIPEAKSTSVIAFVSHIEAELKQRAQEAGANMVLARSAFSTNLPQILKRHAGSL